MSSNTLQQVFMRSKVQYKGGNESLQYHSVSSQNVASHSGSGSNSNNNANESSSSNNKGHIAASVVYLYKYGKDQRSNATSLGKKAAAIVPCNKDDPKLKGSFSLLCYELKERSVIVSVVISNNFKCKLLQSNFLSFADSEGCYWSLRFPSKEIIQRFVCGIAMTRIKQSELNQDHSLIIEDLSEKNQENSEIECEWGDKVTISISMWRASLDTHPYNRGNAIYENDNLTINLDESMTEEGNGNHIKSMKGIIRCLAGMCVNEAKYAIIPPNYAFGKHGNSTLKVGSNWTIICNIIVKKIEKEDGNDNNNLNNGNNNSNDTENDSNIHDMSLNNNNNNENDLGMNDDNHSTTNASVKRDMLANGGSGSDVGSFQAQSEFEHLHQHTPKSELDLRKAKIARMAQAQGAPQMLASVLHKKSGNATLYDDNKETIHSDVETHSQHSHQAQAQTQVQQQQMQQQQQQQAPQHQQYSQQPHVESMNQQQHQSQMSQYAQQAQHGMVPAGQQMIAQMGPQSQQVSHMGYDSRVSGMNVHGHGHGGIDAHYPQTSQQVGMRQGMPHGVGHGAAVTGTYRPNLNNERILTNESDFDYYGTYGNARAAQYHHGPTSSHVTHSTRAATSGTRTMGMAASTNEMESKVNEMYEMMTNLTKFFNVDGDSKNSRSNSNVSVSEIVKCLTDLETRLKASEEKKEALETENVTLTKEVQTLRSKNHQLLEKTNKLMEAQYNALSVNNDESRKLKSENLELMNNYNSLKFEFEELKEKYDGQHSDNEKLQEKLHDSLEKNHSQLSTINELNEIKLHLQNENSQLKQQSENNNTNNESEIGKLRNELNELESRYNKVENENKQLKEEMSQGSELSKKNLEYGERIELLENQVTTLQGEKSHLLLEKEELSKQASALQQEKDDILGQSKEMVIKMKAKYQSEEIDLVKRVLEFMYVRLLQSFNDESQQIGASQLKSALKTLSKMVLADPQSFDEDEDDEEDDVNNPEEA